MRYATIAAINIDRGRLEGTISDLQEGVFFLFNDVLYRKIATVTNQAGVTVNAMGMGAGTLVYFGGQKITPVVEAAISVKV